LSTPELHLYRRIAIGIEAIARAEKYLERFSSANSRVMRLPARSSTSMRRFFSIAVVAMGTCAVSIARAQTSTLPPAIDCLAKIAASALTRVPVYLEAAASDSQSRRALPGVDLLVQVVATRVRSALGATGDTLPHGDTQLSWRQLDGALSLTLYRDGRFIWAREPMPDRMASFFEPSTELLERALAAARDEGERIYVPDELVFDSLAFSLRYTWPRPTPEGALAPLFARVAIPVFSLNVPWLKPAVTVRQGRVRYPEDPRQGFAEGRILLQFVVDTTGRAKMSTVRDLSRPQLPPKLAEYYRAFVAAAVSSVERTRFAPAEIGGCRVPQLVQLPFAFKLSY
jgi:hypothetical protein